MSRLQDFLRVVLLAVAFGNFCGGGHTVLAAEEATGFLKREFTDESGRYAYSLYVPPNYSSDRAWPVVLFLHGAGERGDDGDLPSRIGLGSIIRNSKTAFPAIVVFPQSPNHGRIMTGWSPDRPPGKRALAILKQVEQKYRIDPARRVLTGWSMGGFGSWQIATAYPEMWSAVLPLSGGGGQGDNLAALKGRRLWVIHGSEDDVVSVERSRQSVEALKRLGGSPAYDEVPTGHNVWNVVYSQPDVQKWMLSAGNEPAPKIDWKVELAKTPPAPAPPFVTEAVVPGAIGLRLGNDALQALAQGLPQAVEPEVLSGTLEPIKKTFDVAGVAYRAEFSDLTYSARLANAHIETCPDGHLDFEFGLEAVTLKIPKVLITSATLRVEAGPVVVVLGHQRPVPLCVQIRPRIEGDRLRFVEKKTTFEVADDNWYVSRPEKIRRTGTGLTEYELTTGIVGGVYLQKEQIEEEIRGLVPGLLRKMEDRLAIDVPHALSSLLWPLPVQAPRFRIQPQELWLNGDGLTVIASGLIGTSLRREKPPRSFDGRGVSVSDIPAGRSLSIWASPRLIEAGSSVQVAEGFARINVLDLPQLEFHRLAQPDLWPGLAIAPGESQLDVDLELLEPMRLETAVDDANKGALAITLVAPRVSLTPQTPDGRSLPERAARFRVEQRVRVALLRPAHASREMELAWSPDPVIAPESQESATRQVVEEFGRAWRAWTRSQSGENTVEDLRVGESRLRIEAIATAEPLLVARFAAPQLRIVNSEGEAEFRYRVRTSESYWSEWQTLPAGRTHEYSAKTALEWESRDGGSGRFLPGQDIRIKDGVPAVVEPPHPNMPPFFDSTSKD